MERFESDSAPFSTSHRFVRTKASHSSVPVAVVPRKSWADSNRGFRTGRKKRPNPGCVVDEPGSLRKICSVELQKPKVGRMNMHRWKILGLWIVEHYDRPGRTGRKHHPAT